jgi:HEAT repeat protein
MIGAGGRRLLLVLLSSMGLWAAGCSDLDILPSWFPFQGPASDELPGVVPPAQRIVELRTLSEKAASSKPEERQRVSEQLANSIRTEKDPLIRMEIIRTLGRYPGPAADAILKAAVNDSDIQVRLAACDAWGRRSDNPAVAVLSDLLRSDVDADVRLAAARALGETKNPAAAAALGETLSDQDPALQYQAVLSLEKVTGKDFGSNLARWQQYIKGQQAGSAPVSAGRTKNLF